MHPVKNSLSLAKAAPNHQREKLRRKKEQNKLAHASRKANLRCAEPVLGFSRFLAGGSLADMDIRGEWPDESFAAQYGK
jgi:hypothetical protein